ncbi:iqgap- protein, partial [Spiromyces aspiralis]
MEEPQGHTTHTFNDASSGEPPAEGSAFNIGPTTTGEERAGPEFTNIYQTPPRKKQPSRLARYSGGSHRRSGGARRSSSSLTSRRRRSSTFNGVLNTVADENIPMTVQSNKARERAATAAAIDPGWSTLFVASPYAAPGSISRGSPLRCITPMNIEPPASPSVTGLKGRHRLQRDAAAAVLSAKDLRTGNWCDIERRHIAAYEYLCHVGEAKEWMEACIGSSLPEVGEFEESLRDGVALAKLAATFCPEVVGKIYEKEPPPKGNKRRLEFRHTDNINYFLAAIQIVGLPSLFHFELTDLYDRKNIPRVIHCIHALSHFLLRQGVAPAIKNLVGYLQFSEEQLKQTQKELDTVGTAVPVFTELETHIANQRVTGGKRPKVSNEFDDGWARLEGVERVRKYWEKEIEIVIQFQRLARRQLAVREVTEKRQARRYLEIVRNARIIQSLWRVALARIEFRRRLEENWERIEAARLEREAELERLRREEEEEEETLARQELEQAELERRIREAEAERLYRQKQEEEEIFQQQQLQMDLEREGQKEAERIAQEQRAAAERQAAEMERLAREEAERQRQLELEHIAQVEREEEEARARTQAELEQQHRDLEEQKRELER